MRNPLSYKLSAMEFGNFETEGWWHRIPVY
jgi:hypothetical protein